MKNMFRNCRFCLQVVQRRYSQYSPSQLKQMEESIILVDHEDSVIGPSTKREAHQRQIHRNGTLYENGNLHRAFSVFLFNNKNELLIQQRSSSKITFPNYFTNSCCSHPRFLKEEMDDKEFIGIKTAAQRRLEFELGIPKHEVPLEDLHFLTKIHYSAKADNNWGEHELDYVLFCRTDVNLDNVNNDEVQSTCYFDKKELKKFLRDSKSLGVLITPWFDYISKFMLFDWWEQLDHISNSQNEFGNLQNDIIHRAGIRS